MEKIITLLGFENMVEVCCGFGALAIVVGISIFAIITTHKHWFY